MEENAQVTTRFNSALPYVLVIRNAVFGKKTPGGYTRFTLYFNMLIWMIFLSWHLISYAVITMRNMIFEEKKIDVETMIFCRGEALGFESENFLEHLLNFHLFSAISWGIIFAGLALLWRKKQFSIYVIGIGTAAYFFLLMLYMGINYFNQDTSLFDKVTLSVFGVNLLLYFILYKKESTTSIRTQTEDSADI